MPAKEDHESISQLAARLKLEGEEAADFVASSMKRLGYQPRVEWDDAAPDPKDKGKKGDGGDFFSRGGGQYS